MLDNLFLFFFLFDSKLTVASYRLAWPTLCLNRLRRKCLKRGGATEPLSLTPPPFAALFTAAVWNFKGGGGKKGKGVWSPPALVPTLLAYIHFSSVFSWTIVSTLFTVLKTMFLASKIWTLILRNYAGPLRGTGSKVLWGYFCVSATVLKLVRVRAN